MACKKANSVLPYLTGELNQEEKGRFYSHLKHCTECERLVEEFEETRLWLGKRPLIDIPEGLEQACLRGIDEAFPRKRAVSPRESLTKRIFWNPAPAWRIAFAAVIFCIGLGTGKVLFDRPDWMNKLGFQADGTASTEELVAGKPFQNYLLSVETLFLDLSNTEIPNLMEEEWQVELQLIEEILVRTRRLKNAAENRHPDLFQLVTEIEWVLEELIGAADYNLADFPEEVRSNIIKRQLLTKIHGFIS